VKASTAAAAGYGDDDAVADGDAAVDMYGRQACTEHPVLRMTTEASYGTAPLHCCPDHRVPTAP